MREIKVYAPAKINLYLDVLNKRPDGYHNIETLFEKIDLKDEIVIKEKGKGLKVKTNLAECPWGKDNIVYKAIQALSIEAKINLNLDIIIKKAIPVSAGLGGGSSDAASALKAVNKIFDLGIEEKQLFSIASNIGKDAPFFMLDNSFVIGRGSGELLEPLNIKNSFSHIIIKPKIPISTAEMYKKIDNHKARSKKSNIEKIVYALKKKDITLLEKNYYNIFEEVLGGYGNCIKKVKDLFFKAGVRHSILSGSGPSVFCTFQDTKEAVRIFGKIPKGKDIKIFLVTTYRGGYLWK